MSTPPPIQYSGPAIDDSLPWEVRQHIQLLYQKLGNHTQAISLLKDKTGSATSTTNTIIESLTSNPVTPGQTGIPVNNQSGVTSYTTQAGDDGVMVVLSDASAIAVTLGRYSPPWSCFVTNQGAGTATLTPASGTINGAGSFTLPGSESTLVAFDGANFWAATASVVPQNQGAISHQWVASYNATTGAFTLSQPAFTDISGALDTSQLPSGLFSGTITTAKLTGGGTNGSMTFVNGSLSSQVAAT
jgi:hypothetical protein